MTSDSITLKIEWAFSVTTGAQISDDQLVQHVGEVMDELLSLEDAGSPIGDAALSLDTAERTVLVELAATGPTYPDAAASGLSAIRAAIHAAGGHTPEWPSLADILEPGAALMAISVTEPVACA